MKMHIMLLGTIAMIGTGMAAPALAQASSAKQLRVTAAAEPLMLSATPLRKSHAINEPISLQIELAKPAFVYLYTRDNNGKSSLFKIAGAVSAMPQAAGKTVLNNIFSGDVAGEEEIVVFASAERLKLPAADNVSTRVFEAQLAALGVSVGPKARAAVQDGLSEPVSVVFKIEASTPVVAAATGFAVLNSDKRNYKVGEVVQLALGSTTKGVVQLFSREAGKAPVSLASESFAAAGIKVIKADAAPPAGEQMLLAVWSADGKISVAQLEAAGYGADAAGDGAAKALALRDTPAKPALSVTTLNITVTE